MDFTSADKETPAQLNKSAFNSKSSDHKNAPTNTYPVSTKNPFVSRNPIRPIQSSLSSPSKPPPALIKPASLKGVKFSANPVNAAAPPNQSQLFHTKPIVPLRSNNDYIATSVKSKFDSSLNKSSSMPPTMRMRDPLMDRNSSISPTSRVRNPLMDRNSSIPSTSRVRDPLIDRNSNIPPTSHSKDPFSSSFLGADSNDSPPVINSTIKNSVAFNDRNRSNIPSSSYSNTHRPTTTFSDSRRYPAGQIGRASSYPRNTEPVKSSPWNDFMNLDRSANKINNPIIPSKPDSYKYTPSVAAATRIPLAKSMPSPSSKTNTLDSYPDSDAGKDNYEADNQQQQRDNRRSQPYSSSKRRERPSTDDSDFKTPYKDNRKRPIGAKRRLDISPRNDKGDDYVKKNKVRSAKVEVPGIIVPTYGTSVANLAILMSVPYNRLVRTMHQQGYGDVDANTLVNGETASLLAEEMRLTMIPAQATPKLVARAQPISWDAYPKRAPVVTIMGHVDHGKTSLLDALRQTNVAAGEAGGITQHIGAFSVILGQGGREDRICFLDTPGHAAFSEMRARGARVTDIVVLVVAGDDGIKPQTIEAIKHTRAAEVPMIVAINKCDKHGIDIERVKRGLLDQSVLLEEYGGDVQVVLVSALKGTGLLQLEEAIVTQAEIMDIRGDVQGLVEGVVLEAKLDKGKGSMTSVLITRGTLVPGSFLVAGTHYAKVRLIIDEHGDLLDSVGPSIPVEINGWKSMPSAGDIMIETETEEKARMYTQHRTNDKLKGNLDVYIDQQNKARIKQQLVRSKIKAGATVEEVEREMTLAEDLVPNLSLVLKADVHGSLEAILGAIEGLPTHQVKTIIVTAGVGPVTSSDIELAESTQAVVIAFNVPVEKKIHALADRLSTDVQAFNIIYALLDGIKAMMIDRIPTELIPDIQGEAEILQIFDINVRKKVDRIAGCRVGSGKITRGLQVQVVRNEQCVWKGALRTLRFVKRDINEAVKGSECGIAFEGFQTFQVGDKVQSFKLVEKVKKLT